MGRPRDNLRFKIITWKKMKSQRNRGTGKRKTRKNERYKFWCLHFPTSYLQLFSKSSYLFFWVSWSNFPTKYTSQTKINEVLFLSTIPHFYFPTLTFKLQFLIYSGGSSKIQTHFSASNFFAFQLWPYKYRTILILFRFPGLWMSWYTLVFLWRFFSDNIRRCGCPRE